MKKISLTFLIICSTRLLLHAVSDQAGWESDLRTFQRELPTQHKNLFFKTSPEEFNANVAELKAALPNLSDDEAFWRLQKITVGMGDDHTSVARKENAGDLLVLPIAVGVFSDGIYILSVPEENRRALGARLTAVGNEPISKAITKLAPYISVATKATLRHRIPNQFINPSLWQAAGLAEAKGGLKLTCVTKEQESYTFELQPQTQEASLKNGAPVKVTPKPCPTAFNRKSYFFIQKFSDGKVLYAQYNKCTGREFEGKGKSKESLAKIPSIYEFFEELRRELKSGDIEKFIFDLRWNSGGSSGVGSEFIRELAKNKAINQQGKLLVLIGRRTFSSAIINAFDFKESTHATLIGEPTSGTPTHYGDVRSFTLPNTKIVVFYSTKYFNRGSEYMGSLVPDIAAEQSFEEFLNGKDPAFQAALEYAAH